MTISSVVVVVVSHSVLVLVIAAAVMRAGSSLSAVSFCAICFLPGAVVLSALRSSVSVVFADVQVWCWAEGQCCSRASEASRACCVFVFVSAAVVEKEWK